MKWLDVKLRLKLKFRSGKRFVCDCTLNVFTPTFSSPALLVWDFSCGNASANHHTFYSTRSLTAVVYFLLLKLKCTCKRITPLIITLMMYNVFFWFLDDCRSHKCYSREVLSIMGKHAVSAEWMLERQYTSSNVFTKIYTILHQIKVRLYFKIT